MLAYMSRGSGPDVVLLHPVGLDGTSWAKVVAKLAPSFRVHTIDLAGHGRSQRLLPKPSLADYAGDVARITDVLALQSFTLVGLSFGGMVAQHLAIGGLPALRTLILCGCPSTFPDEVRPSIRERGTKALQGGMAAVADETMQRWFTPAYLASGDAEPIRQRLLADDTEDWAAAWAAISELDTKPRLHEIGVPTSCIAGARDLGSPPSVVRTMAESIPRASYVELPEAPHMMQWECADEFSQAIISSIGTGGRFR
jgi:3-oxoadipate enol-lactonase